MAYDNFNRAAVTPAQAYSLASQLFDCIQDHAGVSRAAALVRAGADLEARFGGTRDTALQRAILCRQNDIAIYLIDNGADIYSPALGGSCNALIYTAMFGDYEDVMEKLLSKGVPADTTPKPIDKTALMWCAEGGKWGRAKLLIEHGADVYRCDDKGKNALDYAQEKQGAAFAKRLGEFYEAVHAHDRVTVMKPLTFKKPVAPALASEPAAEPGMVVKAARKLAQKPRKPKI